MNRLYLSQKKLIDALSLAEKIYLYTAIKFYKANPLSYLENKIEVHILQAIFYHGQMNEKLVKYLQSKIEHYFSEYKGNHLIYLNC